MSVKKFSTLTSCCIPMQSENIDTDQIIPARFLKITSRDGFGKYLFFDQRYDKNGNLDSNNILNNSKYSGKIIVAGRNFGCGSSREHAPWALLDYGFRVILSSFFADIFRNNSLNNGLLVIQLPDSYIKTLIEKVVVNPRLKITIDLNEQKINIAEENRTIKFDIDQYKKTCLLNGYNDIDYLLSKKDIIEKYEISGNVSK